MGQYNVGILIGAGGYFSFGDINVDDSYINAVSDDNNDDDNYEIMCGMDHDDDDDEDMTITLRIMVKMMMTITMMIVSSTMVG